MARAIRATFDRRKTQIPTEAPDCLTPAFADDPAKLKQWTSFVADVAMQPGTLADVVKDLATILLPLAKAARELDAGSA